MARDPEIEVSGWRVAALMIVATALAIYLTVVTW